MAVRLLAVSIALLALVGSVVAARPGPRDESPSQAAATATPTVTPTAAPLTAVPTATPDPSPTPVVVDTAAPTPAPTAAPSVSTPPAAPQPRLVRRLDRVFQTAGAGGSIGAVVVDQNGAVLYARRADTPLLPASTQKLVVAAAALARLGEAFRYTTTVTATAGPDAAGVIDGDIVLVGGGDPTLGSPEFGVIEPQRPRARLERLANRIAASGVRRITGRVLGDPRIFADEPVAPGWLTRYFTYLDTTRVSGLTVNAGRRVRKSGGVLRATLARDPAREAAVTLRRLLRERGVKVPGDALVTWTPPAAAVELARVRSEPLLSLLRYTVQHSDNHLADGIWRTVGAADGDPTWSGSTAAAGKALAPLQLEWSDIVTADGSGLSRANRARAAFLAQLHARMWRSSVSQQWQTLLAVAGRSGTLRYRLRDTVAAGRLLGKTGSLRDVRALVGTVIGPQGQLQHLAVLANDLSSHSTGRALDLIDDVARVVAEELYQCRRQRPPGRTAKGKPHKVRLVCAG